MTCAVRTPSGTGSRCSTRAGSGRSAASRRFSRRRTRSCASSSKDAPSEARERVCRGPRRHRRAGLGRGRRAVALGRAFRQDRSRVHGALPDRGRTRCRQPGRVARRPCRTHRSHPSRPGQLGRGRPQDLLGVTPPAKPAVIAASASLFGEWAATLISSEPPPVDPNIRHALEEAEAVGGGKWPGATLPDIGQLTAQASRIATDIGTVAARVQSAFDSQAVMDLRRSIHDFGQVADRLARGTNEQADVIGDVGSNLQHGSDALARAATDLKATLGRVDTATNQGQLATILNNTAATSTDLRSASQDFRQLMAAANRNQESLVRVLQNADTIMSRISNRSGTLGLLVADSALYRETTLTMIQLRQLLSDIQANPRKYFTFSVF